MNHSFPNLRLKYLADKIGSGKTPLGGAQAYVPTGVIFLRSQNIHFDGLHLDDVVFIDEDTEAEMTSTRVEPDDVLLNITGASLGRCTLFPPSIQRSNVNQHVCIIRPVKTKIVPSYLNSVIQSAFVQSQIFAGENGSSREGLTFEQVGNFLIPLPSLSLQHTITKFLDREVARLDSLMKAKEKVLELLAEKRLALISRAVMRGLNLHISLRESGIPWLGEIPSHWDLERTRWLFQERDERSVAGEEEMLTVSHITGVTPRSEKDVNMFEAETNEGYKICLAGDLAINTLWAWMGAMGVAKVNGIVSPAYHVYKLGPRLEPAYVDALVRMPVFAQEVTRYSMGVWSSRLRLYPEGFFEVFFPVPPIEEQRAIVEYISEQTLKLETMRAATERTILLLKERRAALIAAAVTGQIDMRGAV